MSLEFEKAKQRYLQNRLEAYRTTCEYLSPVLGVNFQVVEWSGRAMEGIGEQWGDLRPSDTAWDWQEIMRRHREPDWLPIVVWVQKRLAAIGLGLTTGQAVELRFLEGDPRQDCPLGGRGALIAVDVCSRYAQAMGRREVRVQPVNPSLERLYRDVLKFELVTPRGQGPYYRKEV